MRFENTEVFNFSGAIRGMRMPLQSHDKSTSGYYRREDGKLEYCLCKEDLELARKLIKAGPEHRKFLRQVFVSVDITAPLYWWKEMDTFKVATVANSESTMHTLAKTPISLRCFELDDFDTSITTELHVDNGETNFYNVCSEAQCMIDFLESLRLKYLETKDMKYWKELIRWLPEGWLQKRTWSANYEVVYNIMRQREGHKLSEWHTFIDWADMLPYMKELIED